MAEAKALWALVVRRSSCHCSLFNLVGFILIGLVIGLLAHWLIGVWVSFDQRSDWIDKFFAFGFSGF